MQKLNATDILQLTQCTELHKCFKSIKNNYSLLEDTSRLFDSKSLLEYEKNIFSLPGEICATKCKWHEAIPPLREKKILKRRCDLFYTICIANCIQLTQSLKYH